MRRTDHGAWSEVGKEGGEAVHESAVQLARESAGLLDRRRAVAAVAVAAAGFHDHSSVEQVEVVSAFRLGGCELSCYGYACIRVPPSRSACLHAPPQTTTTTTTRCTTRL